MTISLIRSFMTSFPNSLTPSLAIYTKNSCKNSFCSSKDQQSVGATTTKTNEILFEGVQEKENLRNLRSLIENHFTTDLNTTGTFFIGLPRIYDDFSIQKKEKAVPRNMLTFKTFTILKQGILDRGITVDLTEIAFVNLAPDICRPGFKLTVSLPTSFLELHKNTIGKEKDGFSSSFFPPVIYERITEKSHLAYKRAVVYIEQELERHPDVRKFTLYSLASDCPPGQENFLQSKVIQY